MTNEQKESQRVQRLAFYTQKAQAFNNLFEVIQRQEPKFWTTFQDKHSPLFRQLKQVSALKYK